MGKTAEQTHPLSVVAQTADARARLTERVKAPGMGLASVAAEVDVSAGALEAWLAGDSTAIDGDAGERILRLLDGPLCAGELGFVMTETARKILTAVEYTVSMRGMSVVWGDPGVGKTMALRHYCDENPGQTVWLKGALHHRRPNAFLDDLMAVVGLSPVGNHESLRERYRQVERVFSGRLKGWAILVDEAQHLGLETMELLRSLHDDTGAPIVMAGNEVVYDRMHGGGLPGWAQLFSRLMIQCRVTNTVSAADIRALGGGELDEDSVKYLQGIARKGGSLRSVANCVRLGRIMADGADRPLDAKILKASMRMLAPGRELKGGRQGAAAN